MHDNFDIAVMPHSQTEVADVTDEVERISNERMLSALKTYDHSKQQYSARFSESSSSDSLTLSRIDELAASITTNLSSVLEANRQVRKYIAKDDVFGNAYMAVQSNVNTDYRLQWKHPAGRNKNKQLQNAKLAVEQFNHSVKLRNLIATAVPATFADGNYIMYLRTDGGNAVVDVYPLGVAEITSWSINGDPIVQINMNEFKSRLRKTYSRMKNGRALFFENLDKEVQANFPKEVYDAYKNGETYCRLDVSRTGVLRINNMGMTYGVSQFFRALSPAVRLDDIETADSANDKAKAKTILIQKLRKEVMGPNSDYSRKGMDYAMYAHSELVKAWSNSTVLYTGIPAVESIEYVEPRNTGTPADKVALYQSKKYTALGIGFVNPNTAAISTANISLKQLMKVVDSISRQLSDILHKYYVLYLGEQGIDQEYAPEITVMNSEQMDMDVKTSLVELMFSKLNLSYESCLEVLGMDVDDELSKRQQENDGGYDAVFTPHASQYTSSGNELGRPPAANPTDPSKQAYDGGYNQTAR